MIYSPTGFTQLSWQTHKSRLLHFHESDWCKTESHFAFIFSLIPDYWGVFPYIYLQFGFPLLWIVLILCIIFDQDIFHTYVQDILHILIWTLMYSDKSQIFSSICHLSFNFVYEVICDPENLDFNVIKTFFNHSCFTGLCSLSWKQRYALYISF